MENASKALLIAGSVLVALLLIGFGLRILNSTGGQTEQVKDVMTEAEKTTFNNKFAGYIGTGIIKAKIKALANLIIANNSTNSHKINFMGVDTSAGIQAQVDSLSNPKYNVVITAWDDGIINSIDVN